MNLLQDTVRDTAWNGSFDFAIGDAAIGKNFVLKFSVATDDLPLRSLSSKFERPVSILRHYFRTFCASDGHLYPNRRTELAGEKHQNDELLRNRATDILNGLDGKFL